MMPRERKIRTVKARDTVKGTATRLFDPLDASLPEKGKLNSTNHSTRNIFVRNKSMLCMMQRSYAKASLICPVRGISGG
jgi:hypothetical protein